MRDQPTVVFELEPVGWNLYNRFIERALANDASNHGNYLKSVERAFHYLVRSANQQEKCALCLFIFSDGRPSDTWMEHGRFLKRHETSEFPLNLYTIVGHNASLLSKRLTFSCFGFGKESEFEVMKEMVVIAKECGAENTEFANSYLDSSELPNLQTLILSLIFLLIIILPLYP